MSTTTYRLTTTEQALEIGTKLSQSWFRGHAAIWGELTPKIYRAVYNEIWKKDPLFECRLIQDFIRLAEPMMSDPPSLDQKIRWIFLMQHHGAPTKLLDWTENVLVGLYFAVRDEVERDGELWAIRPEALNAKQKLEWVPCADEAEAKELLKYFERDPCESLGGEAAKKVAYPLAIKPAMHFARMVSQLSTFTIHPRSTRTTNTIPSVLTDSRDLVRYIIPGNRKAPLRVELEAIGISERTLFSDLDALSRTLVREYERRPNSKPTYPEPPKCGGQRF